MAAGSAPSQSTELAVLSSVINAAILSVLLTGIYTTVYFAAIYLYLTRLSKASRNLKVLAAFTMLYVINIVETAIQWRMLQGFLELDGEKTAVFFKAAIFGFAWQDVLGNVMNLLLSPIADGLLIWHCYTLWDKSLRVVVPSLILLLGQIALYLAVLIADHAPLINPVFNVSTTVNRLLAAAQFATALTTLWTALLIAVKIRRTTHHEARHRFVRAGKNALEALAHSAGVFAVAALVYAVAVVIPLNSANEPVVAGLSAYTGVIFVFLAGMAPTIMVVRAACTSPNSKTGKGDKSRTHLSDLEFRAQTMGVNTSTVMSGSIQVQLRTTADDNDRASLDGDDEKRQKSVAERT